MRQFTMLKLTYVGSEPRLDFVRVVRAIGFDATDKAIQMLRDPWGDDSVDLQGIAVGTARVYSRFGTGENPRVHLAHEGFSFGSGSLLSGEPRRAGDVARVDTVLAREHTRAMLTLLEQRPEWWRLPGSSALEYEDLSITAVTNALIPDPGQRCAATLLRLAGLRPGVPAQRDQVDVPVTQDELAALLRVSRSTLVQIVQRLESRKLVAQGYRSLRIVDARGLDTLARRR